MEFGEIPPFVIDEPEVKELSPLEQHEVSSPTALQLAEKRAELEAIKNRIEPQTMRLSEIKDELAEARKIWDEINARLNSERVEIEDAIRQDKREMVRLGSVINILQRQLNDELAALRQEQHYKDNALHYSKLVSQYKYSDKIMEHQKEGAFFLATAEQAILGDKRGSGKTLTSLATLDALQVNRVLVFCPDDVLSNFVNEIHYWSPHRTVFTIGKMPKLARDQALELAKHLEQFIMVINYSAWRKDKAMLEKLIDLKFECIIADEAHHLKNVNTSAFKGVESVMLAENVCPMCKGDKFNRGKDDRNVWITSCQTCDWYSNSSEHEWGPNDRRSARYRFPMTGTPILNKPQDFFALLHLVDPENFKEERDFLTTYCVQNIWTQKWEFRAGGLDSLTKKLRGRFIAREGAPRPKQNIVVHEIEFDKEKYSQQWKIIEQVTKHAQILLDSGKKNRINHAITIILRKRQANVWPGGIVVRDDAQNVMFSVGDDIQESIKVDAAMDLIREFTEDGDREIGSRVVLFSQFKPPLKEIERRCREIGISVVRFDGDTPDSVKERVKKDFDRKYIAERNGEWEWQVVLANFKTGGEGLNFNAATETIILDEEWNPGKQDQAYGRTDRTGQTEENNVHILRVPETIDTWMVSLNEQKADMINGFEQKTNNLADDLLEAMRNGKIA